MRITKFFLFNCQKFGNPQRKKKQSVLEAEIMAFMNKSLKTALDIAIDEILKEKNMEKFSFNGTPREIRTPHITLRRRLFYPPELPGHLAKDFINQSPKSFN